MTPERPEGLPETFEWDAGRGAWFAELGGYPVYVEQEARGVYEAGVGDTSWRGVGDTPLDALAGLEAYLETPLRISRAKLDAVAALVRALRSLVEPGAAEESRLLARDQPCGCVVCYCEDDEQCLGCGSRACDDHRDGSTGSDPRAVWVDEPAGHTHPRPDPVDGDLGEPSPTLARLLVRRAGAAKPADGWWWMDDRTLVTKRNGSRAVLAVGERDGRPLLVTRDDESGLLVPLTKLHPVAKLIARAPDLASEVERLRAERDEARKEVAALKDGRWAALPEPDWRAFAEHPAPFFASPNRERIFRDFLDRHVALIKQAEEAERQRDRLRGLLRDLRHLKFREPISEEHAEAQASHHEELLLEIDAALAEVSGE